MAFLEMYVKGVSGSLTSGSVLHSLRLAGYYEKAAFGNCLNFD
jgi:hypothetical protein